MALPETPKGDVIRTAIEHGLKVELEAEYEILKKQLIEKLDRQKDVIISGILLHLMKKTSLQTFEEKVVVTIQTDRL